MEDRAEAEKQKNLGNDFYKKKKFPEAIQHYSSAIELHPEELNYFTNLAAVYLEIKEYERAIEQCDHAINKARESGNYDFVKMGKALARKANCLFKMDKLDESIAIYNEALLEHNNYDIKEAKKKVEKHKKELEDKAYINPEIAEQHKIKGNDLFQGGKFVDALKEYDEAVKRDPTNKALYSNRSACLLKLMDPVRALKDAEYCIKLDGKFVKGWARKGTAHQQMKEYHKALDAFKEGLKIEPGNKDCIEGGRRTTELI